MSRIAIRLLGPFEVTLDGAPVTSFEYAKVRALLAYLAVERRPHPRTQLAALLWPDHPERSARASLSQALTTLRNALGDKNAERPALVADVHNVQLAPDGPVTVDAAEFLVALGAAEAHPHRSWRTCAVCAEQLRQALELYRGPFLADLAIPDNTVFEEWVSAQREYLLQRALSGLERLAERARWHGDSAEALGYVRRLVALEPLLEPNQRSLMRLLARSGDPAAALAQYEQLRAALARELGAEPEPATTALFEQIRRGIVPGPELPAPALVVPPPPTALVGRGAELRAICAQLREAGLRALTITGTGGIGKTRLALEAAQALRYDFEDGVYFVELAALSDPAQVAHAIARALGAQEQPHQSISETLREHLRAKQLLLVLDNFEHLLDAAPLVSELLAACPALSVLTTSRAPLQIRAERLFILEPLAEAEALQLFLERAQAAGADLAADQASIAVYAAICGRLDRLPLAIELIAVRAHSLAPLELLQQLERPLGGLAPGRPDLPARHRSLRQAIEWSYQILGSAEQRVFRALGVFAGGCSAEAAQSVLGPAHDVLAALEALTQASLLKQQSVADQTRFLILETIREFALEQLTLHAEAAEAEQRHIEHFVRFALEAYVELLGPEAPRWRAWVAAEYDNLRIAFSRALAQERYEQALQLATGIWRYHLMAGYLREGMERLEAALAYRERAPLQVRCDALRAAGTLATSLNDYPRSRRWLEEAVEIAWRLNDHHALQSALQKLGSALLEQGELEDARIHLEVSLSLAQRDPDPTLARFPLVFLANLHRRLNDFAQAQALCEECLRINQARQDPGGTAGALVTLGAIALAQGDPQRARELAEEALVVYRALEHQLGMGQNLALLGDIAASQGDDAGALEQYQRCLRLWRERENSVTSAFVLDSVGQSLSRLGQPAAAVTLLGAAAAIRERASVKLTADEQAHCDQALDACRLSLGEAGFDAARAAGRALSLTQAIDLALQPLAPASAPRRKPGAHSSLTATTEAGP